jgi:outer membrane receptor for ferrienterochelin and colicin
MAAYSTINYGLTEKTNVVAGLRYEYMNSVMDSETEKGIVDLHYGNLFPTIYLSHKFNKNNTFQFSYSRRINRPTFNELAPFVVFMSPNVYIAGNADLVPAFANVLKTDYQYKSYMLSVSYTNTKDGIARFQPTTSEDGTKQYYISKNLDDSKNVSAILNFPVTVTKWWKMQNNLIWIYRYIKTNYDGTDLVNSQSNYRINSMQSFSFNKRLTGEVTGFYQSKSIWGVYEKKPVGKIDIGMQWKLKNENSKFNLTLTDVFKTSVDYNVADVPELNIYSEWRLDWEPRVLRLTFTHNFGNTAVKARKRNTASEDEQKRITN